jgi:sortase (surface protein transpeptidase)
VSSAVDLETPPRRTDDAARPGRRGGGALRTLSRGIGQTLITLGLIALLFVGYELWVTDLLADREQAALSEELDEQWADAPTVEPADPAPAPGPSDGSPAPAPTPAPIDVGLGEPLARLHIPRLGEDWARVVVEGTAQVQLAQGPGHYLDTAMPGEQGNFAVAGHRVGRGSPFLDLDRLRPGDAIVVETAGEWYVYRVLGDPASGSFEGDPSGIPGMEIVRPTDVDVISPTPGGPAGGEASGAYLTLTTCHPKYSAQQRLIIHAQLEGGPISKADAPDGPPALIG